MASLLIRLAGAVAACFLGWATMAQAHAEGVAPAETTTLAINLDFATLMKVPAATATLVIGNPSVADASVQRNHILVITGKSYGSTNILALDKDGKPLRQITVQVTAPPGKRLTVQRGMERETYACNPRCEQVLTLGDSKDTFGALSSQIGARNAVAAGGSH